MRHTTLEQGSRIAELSDELLAAAQRYAERHTEERYLSGSPIRYFGLKFVDDSTISAIFWEQAGLRPATSIPPNILPIVEGGAGPVLLGGDIQLSTAHRSIGHPSSGKTIRFYNLRTVPVKSGFYTLTYNPATGNYRIKVYAQPRQGGWRTKSKHNLRGDWQPAK